MQSVLLLSSFMRRKKTAKDLQKRDVNATHSHPRFLAQPLLHILAQLQGQLT